MRWQNKRHETWHTKTVRFEHSKAKVPMLTTASGFSRFQAYCSKRELDDDVCTYTTHLIPPDDESMSPNELEDASNLPHQPTNDVGSTPQALPYEQLEADGELRCTPQPFELQAGERTCTFIVEDEEENRSFSSPQQELLYWHHRCAHMSFKRLTEAAELGLIPRRLRNITKFPVFTACIQ